MRTVILQVILCCGLFSYGHTEDIYISQPGNVSYLVEEIAETAEVPWGMAFLNDRQLLITLRQGRLLTLDLATLKITELSGVPEVWAKGQGGLLDVAVPPKGEAEGWIYFTYSKEKNNQGVTVLARARIDGKKIVDWQDIFISRSGSDTGRHYGSRITFDGKGHLFLSIGDRGVRPNAQDRLNHAGSILRLNMDGSVPSDNPFVESESLPEIWSYGHRNPQGLFWDSATGILWSNEHGPRGGDEINIIEPGENYGWPVVSHGKEYWGPIEVGEAKSKPGMKDPLKIYIPSIAPASLLVYSGKAFPEWRGNLFAGALAMTHLNRVVMDEHHAAMFEERLLIDLDERIRAVIESPEGWIYLSTDSGKILRIRPANSGG
jgi:glucose/arabinose dehydrogenase